MKFKNLILLVALILGSCSDAVLVAESKQVKDAKLSFSKLKRALKCVRQRQDCTVQERNKIIRYGSAMIVAVVLLAGGGLSQARRSRPASTAPVVPSVIPGSASPLSEEQRDQIQDQIDRLRRQANKFALSERALHDQFARHLQNAEKFDTPLLTIKLELRAAQMVLEQMKLSKRERGQIQDQINKLRDQALTLMRTPALGSSVPRLYEQFGTHLSAAGQLDAPLTTINHELKEAKRVLEQMKAALPSQE